MNANKYCSIMKKPFKIILNILILILIAGFGYYMIYSVSSDNKTTIQDKENEEHIFISPYEKIAEFDVLSDIIRFYVFDNKIFAAFSDKISIFDLSGNHQKKFEIEPNVRDILVKETVIYLLYPARIDFYSFEGKKNDEIKACSDNSDYCAIAIINNYIFVTDVADKHIVQYDLQGRLVRFIKSPTGFIIPSFAFDIEAINDTLFCVNSGRHKIESYTLDGKFITSFGISGSQAGEFAGCCNPVYIEKSSNGHLLTSEKGNPRISCYGKDGKFRTVLFDSKMLGSGTTAYQIRVFEEKIYIAGKKTISVYSFDKTLSESACNECKVECQRKSIIKQ